MMIIVILFSISVAFLIASLVASLLKDFEVAELMAKLAIIVVLLLFIFLMGYMLSEFQL